MTQVGRAADWTVAAAAVLSGQYPEREQKKRHPFLGGGPTMLISLRLRYYPRVTASLKISRPFTICSPRW